MPTANNLRRSLRGLSDPARAKSSAWFFKTDKGQYGHGDTFLGISVPEQRRIAKQFRVLPLPEVLKVLHSRYHEERLTAVFILVWQYQHGDQPTKAKVAQAYLANRAWVNNWDIVDSSASYILGDYLLNRPKAILFSLAKSKNVWDRRIAVLAAGAFIQHGRYTETLRLARLLLNDDHDLIHKAVGWMLRVVGDHDRPVEQQFLRQYAGQMPRTMLRYAIEKFPETERKRYLSQSARKNRP